MSGSWLDFANNTAQELIGQRAAALAAPSKPVATAANGTVYQEGQQAGVAAFGIPKMYLLAGGAALLLLVGFMAFRK